MRMRNRFSAFYLGIALCAGLFALAVPARASKLAGEFFAGGGVASTNYETTRLATLSVGAGARFLGHVSIGGKAQFDRAHNFYMGYAALYLFPDGMFDVFGRAELGRRDDLSGVDAVGWAAGVSAGASGVRVYLEVGGISEPGYVDGVQMGVLFHTGARLR